jgi:LPXTG-motif cell wall-anchored protein
VDRRSIALKIPFIGVTAGVASLLLFAGAASAHTASVSVQRECAPSSTRATVTFTNDFDLDAVVTYSASKASVSMPANGSASTSFTLTDPTTVTYSVTWSDGVQQGSRSISVAPLTDCVITTTTPPTTPPTTTPPSEAPTTAPPDTAATSIPPETTEVATTTAPTVLGVELQPQAAPKAAPRVAAAPAQLPATGSSDAVPVVAVGLASVAAGALLVLVRRTPRSS